MSARTTGRRAAKLSVVLGAVLLAGGCASQPSLGPNTASGLPSHVDGGARQVLRFCETLHDKGELSTAAAMCERAHRLDPTLPEPLLELASILGEIGEPDLSVEAYRTVLKTAPENAQAHYGIGRIYLDQGQHDLALVEFQAAMLGNPTDPRIHNALGVAQGLLGDHTAAQETYRAGLKVAPNDLALRNNLGLSLVQSGLYDEGVKILQALGEDPSSERASRENLQLAQGLAAAARAEALLAEARAKAEAEAQAQAQAEAEAQAKAGLENPTPAPIMIVNYPQESWPMDGPGTQSMTPTGTLADSSPPRAPMAMQRQTAMQGEQGKTAPITAPTPLTKAMVAGSTPPKSATPSQSAPSQSTSSRMTSSQLTSSQMASSQPPGPQTARANIGGVSDAGMNDTGMPGSETGDAITWTMPRESVNEAAPPAAKAPPPAPRQTAATIPGGAYAVQFASYTSEDRAWRGWDTLRVEATTLLNDVEPKVERADLGGNMGIVYRLRSRPSEKARAESLCAALKGQGINCLVVKAEPKMAAAESGGDPAAL